MSWIGAAIVTSAFIGSNASKSAANTQSQAASNAQQQLQTNYTGLAPNYTPYQQTGAQGLAGLNAQQPYLTTPTQTYQPMTNADLTANLAPNYQFQLQQGQAATNLANNATGGLIGGNALKGLQDYTQNTAQGAYQNALTNYMGQQAQGFNQNQAQQTNIFNRLSGIAGIGQNAVTGISNLATGNATNIAQLGVGAANAQAAGQVGAANAISGGISQAGNNMYLANLLNPNTYNQQQPGYGTPVPQGTMSYVG
jgi:hypothetical protein